MKTRTIVIVNTAIGALIGLGIGIWADQHGKNLAGLIAGVAFLGLVEGIITATMMSFRRSDSKFVEEDEEAQAEHGIEKD